MEHGFTCEVNYCSYSRTVELCNFYLLTDILFSALKITLVNIVKALTTVPINLAVMKDDVKTQTTDVFVRLVIYHE